jgi:hypothetical protein
VDGTDSVICGTKTQVTMGHARLCMHQGCVWLEMWRKANRFVYGLVCYFVMTTHCSNIAYT